VFFEIRAWLFCEPITVSPESSGLYGRGNPDYWGIRITEGNPCGLGKIQKIITQSYNITPYNSNTAIHVIIIIIIIMDILSPSFHYNSEIREKQLHHSRDHVLTPEELLPLGWV
jgi:hypothetical protein